MYAGRGPFIFRAFSTTPAAWRYSPRSTAPRPDVRQRRPSAWPLAKSYPGADYSLVIGVGGAGTVTVAGCWPGPTSPVTDCLTVEPEFPLGSGAGSATVFSLANWQPLFEHENIV
jgi:hypothetical protein